MMTMTTLSFAVVLVLVAAAAAAAAAQQAGVALPTDAQSMMMLPTDLFYGSFPGSDYALEQAKSIMATPATTTTTTDQPRFTENRARGHSTITPVRHRPHVPHPAPPHPPVLPHPQPQGPHHRRPTPAVRRRSRRPMPAVRRRARRPTPAVHSHPVIHRPHPPHPVPHPPHLSSSSTSTTGAPHNRRPAAAAPAQHRFASVAHGGNSVNCDRLQAAAKVRCLVTEIRAIQLKTGIGRPMFNAEVRLLRTMTEK